MTCPLRIAPSWLYALDVVVVTMSTSEKVPNSSAEKKYEKRKSRTVFSSSANVLPNVIATGLMADEAQEANPI